MVSATDRLLNFRFWKNDAFMGLSLLLCLLSAIIFLLPRACAGLRAVAFVRIESFVWSRREKIRGGFRSIAGLPLSRRGFNHYLNKVVVTEVLLESYIVADNAPVENIEACSEVSLSFGIGILRIVTRNAKTNNFINCIVINMVADNTELST